GSEDIHRVVTKLANKHLVVTDQNERKETTVELIHDELFRSWVLFEREWLGPKYLPFLQWRANIEPKLSAWIHSPSGHKGQHKQDVLLRGSELKEAEAWLETRKNDIKPSEKAYIHAGIYQRDFLFWVRVTAGAVLLTLAVAVSIIMSVLWTR